MLIFYAMRSRNSGIYKLSLCSSCQSTVQRKYAHVCTGDGLLASQEGDLRRRGLPANILGMHGLMRVLILEVIVKMIGLGQMESTGP